MALNMYVEKYRPKTFEEVHGREEIVLQLKNFLKKDGIIPHLLFYGNPGVGKTLLSEIIANVLFKENKCKLFYEFNASTDRGIDFVRKDITEIAKRKSIWGDYKIILMDEADNITPDAQAAFRRVFEQYSKGTRFIFTCNYPYKIIDALLSRFVKIEFPPLDTKSVGMYLKKISILENLKFEDRDLINMAKKANGDLRQALNILENGKPLVDSIWNTMTLDKLLKMPRNEKIALAFQDEPCSVFTNIWEFCKREKAWDMLSSLGDCEYKMNNSVHKTVFLCVLLDKLGK